MYINKASSIVDGQILIDWAKGPEDAQFYTPDSDSNFECFVKVENGSVYFSTETEENFSFWLKDWFNTPEDVINDGELNDVELIAKEIK